MRSGKEPKGTNGGSTELPTLKLDFSGRVIQHLGIQMYQSHVDAIAEMIANAWDADATKVDVTLPDDINEDAEIIVEDDGVGMTLSEIQDKYLKVGYDRRQGSPQARTDKKGRPVLGRKGIGKFAGFGIARQVIVKTISEKTGELTEFALDYDRITDNPEGTLIEVSRYESPDHESSRHRQVEGKHGTNIILKRLDRKRKFIPDKFRLGIARRFLLWQKYSDFEIFVNGLSVSEVDPVDLDQLAFELPKDITEDEKAKRAGMEVSEDGWAIEKVGEHEVRWRVRVYKEPIGEELRGFTVFAHGKMAQKTPFFFEIDKGYTFQHASVYISGDMEADFVDELDEDVIATERQRINWSHESVEELRRWGQELVKFVALSWGRRRQEKKLQLVRSNPQINERLGKLRDSERKAVEGAVRKIANFSEIDDETFVNVANSIITAWEQGRLRKLIEDISTREDVDESKFLSLLMEANVLTALNVLEAVATKLEVVEALERKVSAGDLENSIRDYIYENPWIIDPTWEGYAKEKALKKLVSETAEARMASEDLWAKRVDLLLRSGDTLAVLEFVRPKKAKLDLDHVSRFEYYVLTLRSQLTKSDGGAPRDARATPVRRVIGYLISDADPTDTAIEIKLRNFPKMDMYFKSWDVLLADAKRDLIDYAEALGERAPEDDRVKQILEKLRGGT